MSNFKYNKQSLYIGILGLPGAGKSTLARILSSLLVQKNFVTQRYKMSDWIKNQVLSRGLSVTRENAIKVGLKMKQKYGEFYWIERVLVDLSETNIQVNIIETGWHFREFVEMKSRLGKQALLLFVDTPLDVIFQRIKNRARSDQEDSEELYVVKCLQQLDMTDLSNCIDIVVKNGGTLEDLGTQGKNVVDEVVSLLHSLSILANSRESSRIIIIDNDRILLMRRVRFGEEYYVLPGGRIEEGESPEMACIREAKEETGLEITIARKVSTLQYNEKVDHIFVASTYKGNLQIGEPESKRATVENQYSLEWVTVQDLTHIELRPEEFRNLCLSCIQETISNSQQET